MSRKRNKIETIPVLSRIEATLLHMPKYAPASRCGPHKNKKKYDRKRNKQELRQIIQEG